MKEAISKKILFNISEIAALLLWETGAIKVNLDKPFKLVSGNHSPIYINCRLVLSEPSFMQLFAAFVKIISERNSIHLDVVAGGETAGIPFAAYVAQTQSLPMVYVRKKPKGHGIASQVEGNINEGQRILLIEDLITDAASKINFINAIRAAGGIVEDVLVLFDRLQGGRESLEEMGVRLHVVTDMEVALTVSKDIDFLSDDNLKVIREYLQDPIEWHRNRGLIFVD